MTRNETPKISKTSTTGLPESQQFEFFHDAVCPIYIGIRPERPSGAAFDAHFTALHSNDVVVARIVAPGHTARRDQSLCRTAPDDSLFLNFCELIDYDADHLEQSFTVHAGSACLFDNEASFHVRFTRQRRMALHSVRLPRHLLATNLSLPHVNAALIGPPGRLINGQYRLICEALRMDRPEAVAATAQCMVSLLVALCADVGSESPQIEVLSETVLQHLKEYALTHLSAPSLSVVDVGAAFSCTPRTVQKHFSAEGTTFSRWLLNERLARARSLLSTPANSLKSVESLAFACGFRDPTHFHRAFKKRFGLTPGTARHIWNSSTCQR